MGAEYLLPNSNLEPGFPRKLSVEPARRWLHKLSFEVLVPSKGIYFDGHERADVVKERGVFLRKLAEIRFGILISLQLLNRPELSHQMSHYQGAWFGCLHSSDQLAFCMDMELTSELINMKCEQDKPSVFGVPLVPKMQVILANHEDFTSEKPKVLRRRLYG